MQSKIKNYMISISSIAANRYLKKEHSTAYYCNVSLIEAYSKFELKNKISFSSFYNHVKDLKIFKQPHGFTDLCGNIYYTAFIL
jgi:hypothetical protein